VLVFDEKGTFIEAINGFNFPNTFAAIFANVTVNPAMRVGYATGADPNTLQSFRY
jgi:hypothetical protein